MTKERDEYILKVVKQIEKINRDLYMDGYLEDEQADDVAECLDAAISQLEIWRDLLNRREKS